MGLRTTLTQGLACALGAALSAGVVVPLATAAATPPQAGAPAQERTVPALARTQVAAAVPALVPGASGSHIARLQQVLIARGFAIPAGATGYYGTQTRAAVAAFQASQGWRGSGADGVPGPQTLARLGITGAAPAPAPAAAPPRAAAPAPAAASASASAPVPGASGAHVTRLQEVLIARGFAIPAGATGYFGAQTRAAVAAFQASQGWSGSGADGVPGPQTMIRLGLSAGTAAPAQALSPAEFVARYRPLAQRASSITGVPVLVSLGQAALESGWGGSAPGYNFFGIKAQADDPAWSRQLRVTREVLPTADATGFPEIISVTPRPDGRYDYKVRSWFRIYSSADEAFLQHGNLLRTQRYLPAFAHAGDPYSFAAAVAAAGYATDPSYTAKLHEVMRLVEAHGGR